MMNSKYGKLAQRAHLLNGDRKHFDSTELKMEKGAGPANSLDPVGSVLLIADDVSRRLASIVLTRGGYQVETSDTLLKALEILAKNSFDVVLVTEELKDSSGIDAVRTIRSQEDGDKSLNIFGLVQHIEDSETVVFKDSGMSGLIFKGSQLLSALENALQQLERSPNEFIVIKS